MITETSYLNAILNYLIYIYKSECGTKNVRALPDGLGSLNFAWWLVLARNHRKNCKKPKFISRGGTRGPRRFSHRFNIGKIPRHWPRRLKFCTVIGFTKKPKEKFRIPKISIQGRNQGPLTLDEIWCKALPGILEACKSVYWILLL